MDDVDPFELEARGAKDPGLSHFGRAPSGALRAVVWLFDWLVERMVLRWHPSHNGLVGWFGFLTFFLRL